MIESRLGVYATGSFIELFDNTAQWAVFSSRFVIRGARAGGCCASCRCDSHCAGLGTSGPGTRYQTIKLHLHLHSNHCLAFLLEGRVTLLIT